MVDLPSKNWKEAVCGGYTFPQTKKGAVILKWFSKASFQLIEKAWLNSPKWSQLGKPQVPTSKSDSWLINADPM